MRKTKADRASSKLPEKKIEHKVNKWVESKGGLPIKLDGKNKRGAPDRLYLFPGKVIVFLELKAKGKRPPKLQLWWIKKIKALGFPAGWADNEDDAIQFIKENMGPASLPRNWNSHPNHTGMRWHSHGPGVGEDGDGTGSLQDSEKEEAC